MFSAAPAQTLAAWKATRSSDRWPSRKNEPFITRSLSGDRNRFTPATRRPSQPVAAITACVLAPGPFTSSVRARSGGIEPRPAKK